MDSKELKERIAEGSIHFTTILEMMGKPKEHIENTLREYVEKIKSDENFEILRDDFEEAKEVEDGMFSVFVELEILSKRAEHLLWFCFDYMPSSIEIIDPEIIKHNSHDFSNYLNDLQSRLHNMDMIVKQVNATNQKLNRNVEAILKNSIKLSIVSGGNTLPAISANVGVPEQDMANILNQLIGAGSLTKKDNIYSIVEKSTTSKK